MNDKQLTTEKDQNYWLKTIKVLLIVIIVIILFLFHHSYMYTHQDIIKDKA